MSYFKTQKISIITVNLNNKVGLEKTFQSLSSQIYSEFEWIVVDGGSIDGSKEFILSHQDKISKWISEKDSGIYNAMNKGIHLATGDYLLFLNSGDTLYNNDILLKISRKELISDICFGQMCFHHNNGTFSIGGIPTANFSIFAMISSTIPHSASFIRKTLFEKYGGYDESYQIAGDQDFFWRVIIKLNCSVSHLNMIVSIMEDGGVSCINNELCSLEGERLRKANFPRITGDDHPMLFWPPDVVKAMALYNRFRKNPFCCIIYKIYRFFFPLNLL